MQRTLLSTLTALSLSSALLGSTIAPTLAAAPTKTPGCTFERTLDVTTPNGTVLSTFLQVSASCEHLPALQGAQVTYSVSQQRLHGKDQTDVQIGIVPPDDGTGAYAASSVAKSDPASHKSLDSASGTSGQMMILHYSVNK